MKNGVFSTTLKHNVSLLDGNQKNLLRRTNFPWTKVREKWYGKCFFYKEVLIYCEFIQEGQTVNKSLIIFIFRHLWDAISRKHPEKWVLNNWILNYNAPPHWPQLVRNYLPKNSFITLFMLLALSLACWFLPVFLKTSLKGEQVSADAKVVKKNNQTNCYKISSKSVLKALKMLGLVCSCRRRLLGRKISFEVLIFVQ